MFVLLPDLSTNTSEINLGVYFNNVKVAKVSSIKYLGIKFDLEWKVISNKNEKRSGTFLYLISAGLKVMLMKSFTQRSSETDTMFSFFSIFFKIRNFLKRWHNYLRFYKQNVWYNHTYARSYYFATKRYVKRLFFECRYIRNKKKRISLCKIWYILSSNYVAKRVTILCINLFTWLNYLRNY